MAHLQRTAGLAVLGTALAGSAALVAGVALVGRNDPIRAEGVLDLGPWQLVYAPEVPRPGVLLMAVGIALLAAVSVALLERRVATRARRSPDADVYPLSARVVMERTRGRYDGPITITVLVPAHNEEARLGETLTSLEEQTRLPERVVVVADNCTDGTEEIARGAGADVFATVGNTLKKGGALNQALKSLLPDLGPNDLVMVMDADTRIDPGFLETAARRMEDDRALMAVGGLFYGEDGGGILGLFQRNEYHRYQRDITRRRGRPFVLTGTATVFRSGALSAVAEHRGTSLPGICGDVYDTASLTEDNELTLSLKSLGALMISPRACAVVTEVMPTWRALWAQRLRWQRGALENLGAYGVRSTTLRYWIQQLGIGYGVIALGAYFALMAVTAVAADGIVLFPFWIALGLVFAVERVVTAWHGGWASRLLAVTVLPELAYAVFLNAVYVKGVLDIAFGRRAQWAHVTYPTAKPAGSQERPDSGAVAQTATLRSAS